MRLPELSPPGQQAMRLTEMTPPFTPWPIRRADRKKKHWVVAVVRCMISIGVFLGGLNARNQDVFSMFSTAFGVKNIKQQTTHTLVAVWWTFKTCTVVFRGCFMRERYQYSECFCAEELGGELKPIVNYKSQGQILGGSSQLVSG